MDYTDIATLENYGGFTNPSAEDEAMLERLISTASAMVDNFCGRTFKCEVETARTFTDDAGNYETDGRTLWLDEDLCSTPTYAESPAPTVTLVGTPCYNRIVREEGYWPDPTVITGYWAYSLLPPAPIEQAVLRLSLWMYRQKESTDTDRPIIDNGILIMPSSLPKDIELVLKPYRKIGRP